MKIPFQAPEANANRVRTQFVLSPDGSAVGRLHMEATGKSGARLRQLARNQQKFEQGLQLVASRTYTGAKAREIEVIEADDLTKPAKVAMAIEAPTFGRREDRTLRVRLPVPWSPSSRLRMENRSQPVVLGVPMILSWTSEIELPRSMQVVRLPASKTVRAKCFEYRRGFRRRGIQAGRRAALRKQV